MDISLREIESAVIKKSLFPAWGNCGHEVILYDVGIANYTVQTAQWVYDLPGGFCRFLRPRKFSLIFLCGKRFCAQNLCRWTLC